MDKAHAREPCDAILLQQEYRSLPVHDATFMFMGEVDVGWSPSVHQQHHPPGHMETTDGTVMEAAARTW